MCRMEERFFSRFLVGIGGALLGLSFGELLNLLDLVFWDKVIMFGGLGGLAVCAAFDWRDGEETRSFNCILYGLIMFLLLLVVRLIGHIY